LMSATQPTPPRSLRHDDVAGLLDPQAMVAVAVANSAAAPAQQQHVG
jgi:hypothetical protein